MLAIDIALLHTAGITLLPDDIVTALLHDREGTMVRRAHSGHRGDANNDFQRDQAANRRDQEWNGGNRRDRNSQSHAPGRGRGRDHRSRS